MTKKNKSVAYLVRERQKIIDEINLLRADVIARVSRALPFTFAAAAVGFGPDGSLRVTIPDTPFKIDIDCEVDDDGATSCRIITDSCYTEQPDVAKLYYTSVAKLVSTKSFVNAVRKTLTRMTVRMDKFAVALKGVTDELAAIGDDASCSVAVTGNLNAFALDVPPQERTPVVSLKNAFNPEDGRQFNNGRRSAKVKTVPEVTVYGVPVDSLDMCDFDAE